MAEELKSEIVIYKDERGPQIEARFEGETVWLTQAQIVKLFDVKQPAVSKHLNNIFKSGELDKKSVYSILEYTAADGKIYKTGFYNLDAVISVGYRVNSKRATQFRIWATGKLRDYIIKGYAINEKRLKEVDQLKLQELEQAHKLIQKALAGSRLEGYERELVNIISDYTHAWVLFYQYDKDTLSLEGVSKRKPRALDYEKIKKAIERLKARLVKNGETGELFGQE